MNFSNSKLTKDTIRDVLNKVASNTNLAYHLPHQRDLKLTYKDVHQRVNVISQNLLKMGFVKGDRIAFILPNNAELILTLLAAMQTGLISTVLSPLYQLTELEYMFKKAEPKGVVLYDTFGPFKHLDIVKNICPEMDSSEPGEIKSENLPSLKHVIVLQNPLNQEKKTYNGSWEFAKLTEIPTEMQKLPDISKDDPTVIMFTSGTTGNPKGAVISHAGLLNTLQLLLEVIGLKLKTEKYIIPIPIFHIFGILSGVLSPLCDPGRRSVVMADFFPKTPSTLMAIDKFKCNMMMGIPTQFYDLLNAPDLDKFDISSLKFCFLGGSAVLIDLVEKLKKKLKTENIFIGFGMTELSGGHSVTVDHDKTKGSKYAYESCGRALPFTETKIVDKEGKVVPHDTEGELLVRGFHIIKEYWNDPEKTAEAKNKDGWFSTGDIFTMDSEGYLYFKSRRHDVIVRGGKMIHPAAVENTLKSHPEIIGAEAFAVPDERLENEICAWIILKEGSKLTEKKIRKYFKGTHADFKIPRYMKFVDKYPLNVNNKVLKREMKAQSIKEFNL